MQTDYLDPPRGVEWMVRGAEKHHPLGFKQNPLEDAGRKGGSDFDSDSSNLNPPPAV